LSFSFSSWFSVVFSVGPGHPLCFPDYWIARIFNLWTLKVFHIDISSIQQSFQLRRIIVGHLPSGFLAFQTITNELQLLTSSKLGQWEKPRKDGWSEGRESARTFWVIWEGSPKVERPILQSWTQLFLRDMGFPYGLMIKLTHSYVG
jgi:hypothetical protein